MSRATYNESLARIPGIYNEQAEVEIKSLMPSASLNQNQQFYDMFNLNAADRGIYMNEHAQLIQKRMLKQLNVEQFDEFGMPVQSL